MADKRLRYYNGQFLQEQDFTAEQGYHLDRLRRHNRQLHTYGIAEGLTVTVEASAVTVAPGTAIDREGRQIVLEQSRTVQVSPTFSGSAFVVISYAEQTSDPAPGDQKHTRWLENPDVEVIAETGAPAADLRIRLSKLQIVNGTVSGQQDLSVRTSAGFRLGTEVSIERIRLLRQGVPPDQWPVLSSGAAGQADVKGSLAVVGNIIVSGNVDGRDISADGARLDSLGVSTIQGVSNVGGNISLIGQNGITINGNDTANSITFSHDLAQTTGYLRRAVVSSFFNTSSADGATSTVVVGFRPKFIWLEGLSYANLYGGYQGGSLGGFCRCDDGGTVYAVGRGPSVSRFGYAPFLSFSNLAYYGGNVLTAAYFSDVSSTPYLTVTAYIYLDSVSNNGFTIRLSRQTASGYTAPSFGIDMMFAVLG